MPLTKWGILILMIAALIGLHVLNKHLKSQISSIKAKVESLDAPLTEVEEYLDTINNETRVEVEY